MESASVRAGGSASFSAQNGHADGSYAQVNEQAGIQAGSGGFDVNVKGNTNLTGAVISSTADPSQNSVTTGTLTYSDIQNQSHYSAASNGISVGVGVSNTGKAIGPGSVGGSGGLVPMISQDENGDQSATTRSAIGAGGITITNGANQTQDVASLSRDTTNTNGTVSNTPDVQNILSQQADTMQAAQAAGQVVAQGIGAYADVKRNVALASGDQATADAWDEGGTDRVALHVVGGALMGWLGGGSVFSTVGGAAGAGVSAAFAGKLNSLADSIGDGTGSMTLGNVVSNVLAGAGGALVGGSAGAFTASNADLYNRSTGNGDGNGGTGSQFLDSITDQLASAGRGAVNMANQFAALVNANGAQGSYVNPDDLNGPGGNSKPPAAGGSAALVPVCAVPPLCAAVPVVTPGTPGYVPDTATLANSGRDGCLPIPEQVTADNGLEVKSNPKHTPGMDGNRSNAGTEPRNSLDLFNSSVPGGEGVRYAIDSNGNINRFFSDGTGVYHWSGATGDPSALLNVSKIPIDVKRALGFKGK